MIGSVCESWLASAGLERHKELTYANRPRQRPALPAQTPGRRRRSAARKTLALGYRVGVLTAVRAARKRRRREALQHKAQEPILGGLCRGCESRSSEGS